MSMVSPDAPQRASDSPLSSTSTLCRDDKEGGVKLSPDEARTDASNRFYSSLHACQAAVELPQTPGQFCMSAVVLPCSNIQRLSETSTLTSPNTGCRWSRH